MLRIRDLADAAVVGLVSEYGLSMQRIPDGLSISGSFWGEPEAGVVGDCIYVRDDTPVHSLLHEMSHVICMTPQRRKSLKGDAGGDDLEECAVCYLQIVLVDRLAGTDRNRLMQDMDGWGYSFRLGSTQAWFESDADDARAWLTEHGLVTAADNPAFVLRT